MHIHRRLRKGRAGHEATPAGNEFGCILSFVGWDVY